MHYGSDVNEKKKKKGEEEEARGCFPTQILGALRFCFVEAITARKSVRLIKTVTSRSLRYVDTQCTEVARQDTNRQTRRHALFFFFHVSGTWVTIDDLSAATWTFLSFMPTKDEMVCIVCMYVRACGWDARERDLICNQLITRCDKNVSRPRCFIETTVR